MKKVLLPALFFALCIPMILKAGIPAGERPGPGKRGHVTGHVVVKFRENAPEWEKVRARRLVSGREGRRLKRVGIEKVHLPPGWDEEKAVEILSRDPAIESVQMDARVELLGSAVLLGMMPTTVPDDPSFGQQWHLDAPPYPGIFATPGNPIAVDVDIDAPEAWTVMSGIFDSTRTAAVGVIDSGCGENGTFDTTTGYHPQHEDLPLSVLFTNSVELPGDGSDSPADINTLPDDSNGWDFAGADNVPADDNPQLNYHGTLISGIIGADWDNGLGVAGIGKGQLQVLPLRFVDSFFDVVAAVEYAMDLVDDGHAVRVLNMSFKSDNGVDPSGLRRAVSMAGDRGIAVVAAAGNDLGNNNDDNLNRVWPAEYTKDSSISSVMAVAATGTNGFLAGFSNIGPNSVQMAAPGVGIRSAYNGSSVYADADGTSFSTPIAGAALGLVMAAHPALSPGEAIDRVVEGGDFDARLAGLIQSGKRVNLAGALAPFHPYSGLAYVGDVVNVSLYADTVSRSYGAILGASADPGWSTTPLAASAEVAGGTTLTLTALSPGIAQYTLTFSGSSAPVGTYDTGPWRVTAISPFTAEVGVNRSVTFNSLLEGAVTWAVTDTTVASISSSGVLTGLSEGMTRVILSVDGITTDYSGWVLVHSSSSGSSSGGCGTTAFPADPDMSGLVGMTLTGLLLLGLRRRWLGRSVRCRV